MEILEKHITIAYYGSSKKYFEFDKFNGLEIQIRILYSVIATSSDGINISFYVVEILDEEIKHLQKTLLNKELNHITMSCKCCKPALSGEIHKLIYINKQNEITISMNGSEKIFNITYDNTQNGELTGVFGESS